MGKSAATGNRPNHLFCLEPQKTFVSRLSRFELPELGSQLLRANWPAESCCAITNPCRRRVNEPVASLNRSFAEFGWDDDVAFCEWMARTVGVAAVPGSSFFREPVRHLIRFHFAKQKDTLIAAGQRLLGLRAQARQQR